MELRGIFLKDIIFQIVLKAVNDTAGLDGLVPTLLVFSTFL
jgi:hypothetical protein